MFNEHQQQSAIGIFCDQNGNQNNNPDNEVHMVDAEKDSKEETSSNRPLPLDVLIRKTPESNHILNFEYRRNKDIINDELDKISLSSEEDEKINFESESKKLTEYYEENEDVVNGYIGTKNELIEKKEIPVIFDKEPGFTFEELGYVLNIYKNEKILIKSISSGSKVLDLDNVLFDENYAPIAFVDDVIGRIDFPIYISEFFPSVSGEVRASLIGKKLLFVKQKVKFVEKCELIKKKGCDASNYYDEEICEEDRDFSDDEAEKSGKKNHFKNSVNLSQPKGFVPYFPSTTNQNFVIFNPTQVYGQYFNPMYSNQMNFVQQINPFQFHPTQDKIDK